MLEMPMLESTSSKMLRVQCNRALKFGYHRTSMQFVSLYYLAALNDFIFSKCHELRAFFIAKHSNNNSSMNLAVIRESVFFNWSEKAVPK